MKKVLIFFPHNPYPPKTGAHKRCLAIISGLQELGLNVILISSTLYSETRWDEKSIKNIRQNLCLDVRIHKANLLEIAYIRLLDSTNYCMNKNPPFNSVR
jgi:hypothetical protein